MDDDGLTMEPAYTISSPMSLKAQVSKKCVVQVTVPTLKFYRYPKLYLQILSLKKIWSEKYNKTVHLKKKTKGLCILKDFFL